MLRAVPRLLRLPLLFVLLTAGCGSTPRPPMSWVIKEGVFTLTPGKPLEVKTDIVSGSSNAEYEIMIEVKVASGDAVTVDTRNTDLMGVIKSQRPRLSTTTPVKELKLTEQIREDAQSQYFLTTISTAGKSSDVSVKVTKQHK